MPWAVAGAAVAGAASLGGAAMQSSATSSASKAAQQDQRIAYLMADANLAPYRKAGEDALHQVEGIVGGGWGGYQNQLLAGFRTDPGYQFARDEGLDAVQRAQNAAHILDSGDTTKATLRYAEGIANQQYGAYVDRFGNYVNRLYSLAGAGQNSATQSATNALNTGTNLSNIAASQGAADASIYGNVAKGLGTVGNNLFSNPSFQNWLGGSSSSIYGNSAPGTPGISSFGNPVMTGYAPAMVPGQVGIGGFTAGVVGNPYTPSISGVPSPY